MATFRLTEAELDYVTQLKDNNEITQAWAYLGEKGDAYAFLASYVVDTEISEMPFPANFFAIAVREQWGNATGSDGSSQGDLWGTELFFSVGKKHLDNYLLLIGSYDALIEDNQKFYIELPSTEAIEASYKDALKSHFLSPITAIDSIISVLDTALGKGVGRDYSWAEAMNMGNKILGGPRWETERIEFNSEVFIEDIDPLTAFIALLQVGSDIVDALPELVGLSAYDICVAAFGVVFKSGPIALGMAAYMYLRTLDQSHNYKMINMANDLGVTYLLQEIGHNMSFEDVNFILGRVSKDKSRSAGTLINTLSQLFKLNLPDSFASREQFYDNLRSLRDWHKQEGIQLSFIPTHQYSNVDDLAYRYALANWQPFVVTGLDYSRFNQQGELNVTEAYMRERRNALVLYGNYVMSGQTGIYMAGSLIPMLMTGDVVYYDAAFEDGEFRVDGFDLGVIDAQHIGFGGGADDHFVGEAKDDSFFGGAGDDTLNGGKGNNYLEGGAGFDTYIIGKGHDTIVDSDGLGKIEVDGNAIGGTFYAEISGGTRTYLSADRQWRLQEGDDLNGTLVYSLQHFYKGSYLTKATLHGWQDAGQPFLGITLNEQPFGNTLIDLAPWVENLPAEYYGHENSRSVASEGNFANMIGLEGLPSGGPIGVIFGDSFYQIHTTFYGDYIKVGDGGGFISGYLGNDYIETGSGNDWIIAGAKVTNAFYSDKDIVVAGKGTDYVNGGDDNDTIYSDIDDDIEGYSLDERGDFVIAGEGNDRVYGSHARDILLGGAGEEVIYGGGGDDLILGDADYQLMYSSAYTSDLPANDIRWNKQGYFESGLVNGFHLMMGTSFHWDWSVDAAGVPTITNVSGFFDDAWLAEGGNNDVLYGGKGNDWIAGQTGDDILMGGEGDDILYGDDIQPMDESLEGNDFLYGGTGADKLYGGGGNDILYAGEVGDSREQINADTAKDELYGGKGNDIFYATGGGDLLYGEAGSDVLYAAHGATLSGGEDNDVLHALDANNAVLNGDEGDDFFYAGTGDNVQLFAGTGDDAFYLSTGTNTRIDGGGSGNNRYFITKETCLQGNSVMITNDSGAWTLYADDKEITAADLIRDTDAGVLYTNDGQYILSNVGGNLSIRSSDTAHQGQVIIENGTSHSSFTELWSQAEDINNQIPETVGVINDQSINKGETLSLNVTDYFKDEHQLEYSAFLVDGSALPSWLTIDENTGLVSGTPVDDQEKVLDVVILARDPYNKAIWQTVTIEVNKGSGSTNHAPIINELLGNPQGKQDENFSFVVPDTLFTDPDGDTLTYNITLSNGAVLPNWLAFDAVTRTLSGTPDNDHVGILELKITATDPKGLSASQAFNVIIENVNDAPQAVGALANQTINPDEAWVFALPSGAFIDIDTPYGDSLTYHLEMRDGSDVPAWLMIDAVTGTLSGTPLEETRLEVAIVATDLGGLSATHHLNVDIKQGSGSTNHAPIINELLGNPQGKQDENFSFVVPDTLFTDPDGDTLTYNITLSNGAVLPNWLAFDAVTRTLSGTPDNDHVGILELKITATDPKGLSASQAFNVIIENVNDAPQAVGALAYQTINPDEAWVFALPSGAFIDIDTPYGDSLTYHLEMRDGSDVPAWLMIDAVTGTLSGTPLEETRLEVAIVATDLSGLSASHSLSLTIDETMPSDNRPPEVHIPLKGLSLLLGSEPYVYNLPEGSFIDPDGDALSYSIAMADGSTLPYWIKINPTSGRIYIFSAPVMGQSEFTVTATDSKGAFVTDVFRLEIKEQIILPENQKTFYGSDSNEVIYGNDYNNCIYAGGGDDELYGGLGNDLLMGEGGNNLLVGGKGNDILTGGNGKNTFRFSVGDGQDIVSSHSLPTLPKEIDRIEFTDVALNEAIFSRQKDDLIIRYGKNDSVNINDYFREGFFAEIQFTDAIFPRLQKVNEKAQSHQFIDVPSIDQEIQILLSAMSVFCGDGNPSNDPMFSVNNNEVPPSFTALTTNVLGY